MAAGQECIEVYQLIGRRDMCSKTTLSVVLNDTCCQDDVVGHKPDKAGCTMLKLDGLRKESRFLVRNPLLEERLHKFENTMAVFKSGDVYLLRQLYPLPKF